MSFYRDLFLGLLEINIYLYRNYNNSFSLGIPGYKIYRIVISIFNTNSFGSTIL